LSAPRILFIGGWGRSGSTLLALMLGRIPGFVTVGEVREVWRRGLAEDGPCGCGLPFRACPFWSEVGDRAFGGWDALPLGRVMRERYRVDRGWMTPFLAFPGPPLAHRRAVSRYVATLDRLYRAISEVAGARWVVDSSKLPSHALLLRRIGGDLRILHLVRDSRGVAFSWQKQVSAHAGSASARELGRYGPIPAALRYTGYNAATSALRHARVRYLRMRYEDLVDEPETWLRRTLAFADEPTGQPLPFLEGDRLTPATAHTADGNPVRFAEGAIQLRLDDAWRHTMRPSQRRLVTLLTAPSLAAYGYPMRG
jgi:Sulfotransferase family